MSEQQEHLKSTEVIGKKNKIPGYQRKINLGYSQSEANRGKNMGSGTNNKYPDYFEKLMKNGSYTEIDRRQYMIISLHQDFDNFIPPRYTIPDKESGKIVYEEDALYKLSQTGIPTRRNTLIKEWGTRDGFHGRKQISPEEKVKLKRFKLIANTIGRKPGSITDIKNPIAMALFSSFVVGESNIKKYGPIDVENKDADYLYNKEFRSLGLFFDEVHELTVPTHGIAIPKLGGTIKVRFPFINVDSEENKGDYIVLYNKYFMKNTVLSLVRKGVISDEYYQLMKGTILDNFNIFLNITKGTIGMTPKHIAMKLHPDKIKELKSKYIFKYYSKDKLIKSKGRKKLEDEGKLYKEDDINIESLGKNIYEELMEAEQAQGYINDLIGDKARGYTYAHMIRKRLKLKLQTWQVNMLKHWKRFNIIAGSRRIGKTKTSAHIAHRELYKQKKGFGGRDRQIIYVTLTDQKAYQPWLYLMQDLKEDIAAGYISVKQAAKEITNKVTGATLKFITSGASGGAASYGADMIIIDEAAMIDNDFWEDLLPIILQEESEVFAISTINETSRKNWFYRMLLDGENQMNEGDIQALRVTIEDNELITQEARDALKEQLKDNQIKYWTQLYSIFPSGSDVFDLTGVLQVVTRDKPRNVIIGYDPAKYKDNASFVLLDVDNFYIFREIVMQNITYKEQKDKLQELIDTYENVVTIMDRTGVGEGVYEIFGNLINYSVRYKGTGDITYNEHGNYYLVPKSELVDTTKLYIQQRDMKISPDLINLQAEFKGFKVLTINKGLRTFGGVGITDDSVNSAMLSIFCLSYILNVKSKGELVQYQTELKPLDKHLYNVDGTEYLSSDIFSNILTPLDTNKDTNIMTERFNNFIY